jgi:DAACS family dicarboxylate/amino acid:cation (Na+ or H+) symporter
MKFDQSYRMLAGLALGVVLGVTVHVAWGDAPALQQFVKLVTEPAGKIFLRLLFVLVLPLIVSALALGVSGLGDLRSLGRIGAKTFAYTVIVSTTRCSSASDGEPVEARTGLAKARLLVQASAAPAPAPGTTATGVDFVVALVPGNVIKAMADGDMLAVMVFALLLGLGLAATRTEYARRLEEMLQGLYDVTMRLLEFVIRIAPVGVACLTFTLTARLGYDVLRQRAFTSSPAARARVQQFVATGERRGRRDEPGASSVGCGRRC